MRDGDDDEETSEHERSGNSQEVDASSVASPEDASASPCVIASRMRCSPRGTRVIGADRARNVSRRHGGVLLDDQNSRRLSSTVRDTGMSIVITTLMRTRVVGADSDGQFRVTQVKNGTTPQVGDVVRGNQWSFLT